MKGLAILLSTDVYQFDRWR